MWIVAEIHTSDECPIIKDMQKFINKEDAVKLALRIVKENEPPDNDARILEDLEDNGLYYPEKHSEWSVQIQQLI